MRVRDYLNPMHGWKDSSDVEKVRVYTLQSFQLIIAAVTLVAVVACVNQDAYVAAVSTVICGGSCLGVLQRTPGLGGMSPGGFRTPLVALLGSAAVLVVVGEIQTELWAAILVSTALAALVSLRWSLAASVAAAALAAATGVPIPEALIIGLFVITMATAVRLSMWLLRIVKIGRAHV